MASVELWVFCFQIILLEGFTDVVMLLLLFGGRGGGMNQFKIGLIPRSHFSELGSWAAINWTHLFLVTVR